MKVAYEVDVILKFHTATTGNSDYVVVVSLVKWRHKAVALGRDFLLDVSDKKICIVRAHLTADGDSSYLFVKITVKSEGI